MEPWVTTLITGLVASGVTFAGFWFTRNASKRATATQEKQARDSNALALNDKWQAWAEKQEQRVEKLEQEREKVLKAREQDQRELSEMHQAIDTLRIKVQRLEGRLIRAVEYIRDLLAWARAVSASTPHPAVPDDIADLIDPDGK